MLLNLLFDPTIALWPVPPLPDVDNDELGVMEVDQNNHPGDAAETNENSVLFYDALTALLALDDSMMPHQCWRCGHCVNPDWPLSIWD
jgi:hypothetical protein